MRERERERVSLLGKVVALCVCERGECLLGKVVAVCVCVRERETERSVFAG